MDSICCRPYFVTDGLTRKDEQSRPYIKYFPENKIGEIRDVYVDGGRLREVYDKFGEKVMTLGAESGMYTTDQVLGVKLNTQA